MKLSKRDLQQVFDLAHGNFMNYAPGELNNQEFLARCYLDAAISVLGIGVQVEYPQKKIAEPVD